VTLLTHQEQAVVAWITAAISDCPELAPLTAIVWSDQDALERARPYALLSYTGSDGVGASPARTINESDELETASVDTSTVSITIVSKPSDTAPTRAQVASSYTRELKARVRSFVGYQSLLPREMTVQAIFEVPLADRLAGSSQWETRAVLDLQIRHSLVVTEQPGIVLVAEIDGETDPPTPNRTLLAG
jgi:hypothetical protein